MSWQERTRDTIEFTSPLKKRFFALWGENSREMENSLGLKKYPKIDGVFVQPMGFGGVSYPLNFFFEGPDHDLEAQAFFQTCREVGAWEIIHPTLGKKNLYLASVSQDVSSTNNANTSGFDSAWIESIAKEEILSRPSTPEFVSFQSTIIFDAAADEFNRNIVQDTETQKQAIRNTSRSLLSKIKGALASLYQLSNEINARVNAIQAAINSTLNEFILRPLQLAAQFQQLIALPALAINNVQARLESYRDLAESIFEDLIPTTTFPRDKNIAACLELNLGAALSASAQSLVTGPLPTRQAAIENAEFLLNLFAFITDGLDNIEALFKNLQADQQFFTQSDTFAQISELIALAADAAIKQSFDLAIEKRFILENDRAPIEITITEYGNPEQLELFNTSNALQGDELILLPAGKEVVVYI